MMVRHCLFGIGARENITTPILFDFLLSSKHFVVVCGCVCRLAGWWSSLSLSLLLLLLLPKAFSFSLPTPRQEQQQHRSSGKVGSHRRERERQRERTRDTEGNKINLQARVAISTKQQKPRIKNQEKGGREGEREGESGE